jgi:hypothetical protein
VPSSRIRWAAAGTIGAGSCLGLWLPGEGFPGSRC